MIAIHNGHLDKSRCWHSHISITGNSSADNRLSITLFAQYLGMCILSQQFYSTSDLPVLSSVPSNKDEEVVIVVAVVVAVVVVKP